MGSRSKPPGRASLPPSLGWSMRRNLSYLQLAFTGCDIPTRLSYFASVRTLKSSRSAWGTATFPLLQTSTRTFRRPCSAKRQSALMRSSGNHEAGASVHLRGYRTCGASRVRRGRGRLPGYCVLAPVGADNAPAGFLSVGVSRRGLGSIGASAPGCRMASAIPQKGTRRAHVLAHR
jgi:hypothetical protein